jgi:hypothetical protein
VSYFLAPSLVKLRNEVDRRHPNRDKSSDGWIGDPSHAARVSDHNPDGRGMVHAIDVDSTGIDVRTFLRAVIGDPRTWYVIHDGTIWSRTYGFKARRYTGSNPHTGHVHVSIRYTAEAEQPGGASWYANTRKTKGLPTLNARRVLRQLEARKLTRTPGVRAMQRALNDRLQLGAGRRLDPDGFAGARTRHAFRVARKRGESHVETLRRIGRGRYRVRK